MRDGLHEVVSHLERVPQVARQMWKWRESTRVCTEDGYVAKAVADRVEYLFVIAVPVGTISSTRRYVINFMKFRHSQ